MRCIDSIRTYDFFGKQRSNYYLHSYNTGSVTFSLKVD